MKEKKVFYCELAYIFGIIILAFGNSLMERADLGMSMVVAPAYLIHLKVSEYLPFFTFGMSGYVFQALLLSILAIVVGKVKRSYFLSFVTAFLYGVILDLIMSLVAFLPLFGMAWRVAYYSFGLVICSTGVALLFHSYFPPEAYDLAVKELSRKFGFSIGRTKTVYDLCSCILGVILSLSFFGTFVGVKWGTVICAFVNGWLIGGIGRGFDKLFVFKDALQLREKINN